METLYVFDILILTYVYIQWQEDMCSFETGPTNSLHPGNLTNLEAREMHCCW